ncbi:MAG: glycosyltransferase family 2 protein [Bacteroidales bacterium]|nr:glycosyltransferase family 2 protein [Bacteroidales bacterium]
MKAAVVILNWNGKGFLEKYLPVLIEHTPASTGTIIIADNGSTDGSTDMLKSEFPTVQLLEFDRNYGFTGGYNRALAQLEADYFVLINSDIRVSEGWLDAIIDFMENNPGADICMPKILSEAHHEKLLSNPGVRANEMFEYAGACGGFIDCYGFPFCRGRILSSVELDHGQYDTPMEVFWATGACMVVKSSVWREVGGLDESFFAHMEEIDFCWRAKLLGHEVWVVPQSTVYHVGGGTLPNNSPRKLYLNYRNNLLMLYKNLPFREDDTAALIRRNLFLFKRMCIDGLSGAVYLLQGKWQFFKAVVNAHSDYRKMKGAAKISPRLISYTNASSKNLSGAYNKSIILKFFTGSKRFSQLKYKG